jgi:hypothetical protein
VSEFQHSEEEAVDLIDLLLASHAKVLDEDFIHYESSYGVAAAAHYFGVLGGRPETLREWRSASNLVGTPPAALEYFRTRYFVR